MIKSHVKELETVCMPPLLHELITTPKPSKANRKLLQQAHHRFDSSPVFASPSDGVSFVGCLIFFVHVPCGRGLVLLWWRYLRYVVYFRFCGWCHIFILDFSVLAFSNPAHSYFNFPYLRFPSLRSRTWIFRTCIFHPYTFCHFVLHFSILAFSSTCNFSAPAHVRGDSIGISSRE